MKKTMKLAIVAAGLFVAATSVAKAQEAGARQQGRRGGGQMAAMMKDIALTDAQKSKLDSITKVFADKNAPLMELSRSGNADARAKMSENRKAETDAVRSVLTDEQKKTFDANVAAMQQERRRPPVGV